jgi:hypothetical protein
LIKAITFASRSKERAVKGTRKLVLEAGKIFERMETTAHRF